MSCQNEVTKAPPTTCHNELEHALAHAWHRLIDYWRTT
jgi:hypothetical protein